MEDMRSLYCQSWPSTTRAKLSARGLSRRLTSMKFKERIGLNDRYEEYAIHDYELPFQIEEYTPIEEVNRLCAAG